MADDMTKVAVVIIPECDICGMRIRNSEDPYFVNAEGVDGEVLVVGCSPHKCDEEALKELVSFKGEVREDELAELKQKASWVGWPE